MKKFYYIEDLVSGKNCFIKGINPKTGKYSAVGYAASYDTYSFTSKIKIFDDEIEAKSSDLWEWLGKDNRKPIIGKNYNLIDEELKNKITRNKKSLRESTNTYKTDFTKYITLEFTALLEDNKVEIDFVNKEDNYYLGVFDVDVDAVNWYDDESVCNFVSKEIINEVLSNYLYHYSNVKNYKEMAKVCKVVKQITEKFEDLLDRLDIFEPNVFSYAVIELFNL